METDGDQSDGLYGAISIVYSRLKIDDRGHKFPSTMFLCLALMDSTIFDISPEKTLQTNNNSDHHGTWRIVDRLKATDAMDENDTLRTGSQVPTLAPTNGINLVSSCLTSIG